MQQPKTDESNDSSLIPIHLGLIIDGNRRWAKENGLKTLEGHRKGYFNLKEIALAARDRGVKCISAFVFSTENWNRAKEEVSYLMDLLLWVSKHEVNELHKKNIKLVFSGTKDKLGKNIINAMEKAKGKTAKNTGGTLNLCLNYGGQQEISDAAARLLNSDTKADEVTPELFAEYLYQPNLPPLDLVIRTSGEKRLSGFMLWSAAYAELMFVDKLWPAFTVADLDAALLDYSSRQRRFGA